MSNCWTRTNLNEAFNCSTFIIDSQLHFTKTNFCSPRNFSFLIWLNNFRKMKPFSNLIKILISYFTRKHIEIKVLSSFHLSRVPVKVSRNIFEHKFHKVLNLEIVTSTFHPATEAFVSKSESKTITFMTKLLEKW